MVLAAYLSGIFTMGLAVSALLFLRAWTETRDWFFRRFALAFALLALERVVLVISPHANEPRSLVYLIRLVGFLIIMQTIYQKRFAGEKRAAPKRRTLTLVKREAERDPGAS